MKNTYLICMIAFVGLGLADLFYLNSQIIPALWPETNKMVQTPSNNPTSLNDDRLGEHQTGQTNTASIAFAEPTVIKEKSFKKEESTEKEPAVMTASLDAAYTNKEDETKNKPHETEDDEAKLNQAAAKNQMPHPDSKQEAEQSLTIEEHTSFAVKTFEEPKKEKRREPALIEKFFVYFDSGTYQLKSKERKKLKLKITDILNKNDVKAIVEGHADHSGAARVDNDLLSQKRAEYVAKILSRRGIKKEFITTIWHGDKQPLTMANTPEALAKNRRAEIKLFKDMP